MKSVEEIYQEMAETFAQETGVEVNSGGDMSVRLYAVAAEIYALYVQGEWVARQCFPPNCGWRVSGAACPAAGTGTETGSSGKGKCCGLW